MGQSRRSPNSSPSARKDFQPPHTGIEDPNSAYQQTLEQTSTTTEYTDPDQYPGFEHLDDDEFTRENGPPDETDDSVRTGRPQLTSVESEENRWTYDEDGQLSTEQKAKVAERKSNASQRGYDDAGRPYRASDPSYSPEDTAGDVEQRTFREAINSRDGVNAEEVLEETEGQAVVTDSPHSLDPDSASQERRIETEIDQQALEADTTLGEAGSFERVGGLDPTGEASVGFDDTVSAGPRGSQTIPGSHLTNTAQLQHDLKEAGYTDDEAAKLAEYAHDQDYLDIPTGTEPRGRGMDLATQERIEGETAELHEYAEQAKKARRTILRETDHTADEATELLNELHKRRRDRATIQTEIEAEGRETIPGRSSQDRERSQTPPSRGGDYLYGRNADTSDSALDYESSLIEANQTLGQLPQQLVDEYVDTPTQAYWENGDVSLGSIEKRWVDNLKRNLPPDLVENTDPTDPHAGLSFDTSEWSQQDLNRFKSSLEKAKSATVTDIVRQTETVRPETVDAVEPFSRHTIKGEVKHIQTEGIKDFNRVLADTDGEITFGEEGFEGIENLSDTLLDRDDGAGIKQIVYLENSQGDDLKIAVTESTENPHPDEETRPPYQSSDEVPTINEGDTISVDAAHLYYYNAGERTPTEGSLFDSGGWQYSAVTDRRSSVEVEAEQSDG